MPYQIALPTLLLMLTVGCFQATEPGPAMRRRAESAEKRSCRAAAVILVLLLVLLDTIPARAQCCVVGVPSLPVGSSEVLPIGAGSWEIATVVRGGWSSTVLEGTSEVEVPLSHTRGSLAVIGRIEYAWTDRFSVQALVPYILERTITSGFASDRSRLGDVNLMFRYAVLSGPQGVWRARIGSGVSLPLEARLETGLGSDPNQSSGTRDLLLSGGVLRYTGEKTAVDASVSYRLVTSTDDQGRHLGNVLQTSAGWVWGVRGARLPARLGLAVLYRERDVLDGVVNRNSGGLWVYAMPGIAWDIMGPASARLQVTLSAEVPLYREVNGQQLTEDLAVLTGLSYRFGGG